MDRMLRTVHQLVIWALVAVIACGNGLSYAATANGHVEADLAHLTSAVISAHHHEHTSPHGHDHASGEHQLPVGDLGDCGQANCSPDEAPGEPCCHVHAHCCMSVATLHSAAPAPSRVVRESAMLFDLGAAVPLGAISYPLLRPPRAAT